MRVYTLYIRHSGLLDYIGKTEAVDEREAFRIIMSLKYRVNIDDAEFGFDHFGDETFHIRMKNYDFVLIVEETV